MSVINKTYQSSIIVIRRNDSNYQLQLTHRHSFYSESAKSRLKDQFHIKKQQSISGAKTTE